MVEGSVLSTVNPSAQENKYLNLFCVFQLYHAANSQVRKMGLRAAPPQLCY